MEQDTDYPNALSVKLAIYKGLDIKDRVEIQSTVLKCSPIMQSANITQWQIERAKEIIEGTHYPDITTACLEAHITGIQWN